MVSTTSYMTLVANTPCSESLQMLDQLEIIKEPFPCKYIKVIETDYDCIEKIDRTGTREGYATFICALTWGQLNLSNVQNRNRAFNCLRYIGEDTHWLFQSRMEFHSTKAYRSNRTYFTPKQKKILDELLPIITKNKNDDNNADDVDTDDDDARDAPGICPSCQEEAPGPKYVGYECSQCTNQTQKCLESYFSD